MIDISILKTLEPISALSPSRIQELATLCFREKVGKGIDPFRMNVLKNAQALYLLNGQLELCFNNGTKTILMHSSEQARHPIDPTKLDLKQAYALTEIEIIRIDLDLLDIMMTWDQLAILDIGEKYHESSNASDKTESKANRWMTETSAFAIDKLQTGIFSRLPSSNIEQMFLRMVSINVKSGQTIIRQGDDGDYFYLIEKGAAIVRQSKYWNDVTQTVAELHAGNSFGEDALVSGNKRNASVIMATDGELLRLSKSDFIDLLKTPLIEEVSMEEAQAKIEQGAVWLDVRLPSEYRFNYLKNSINIPLNKLRDAMKNLDSKKEYIVYCQTGRRSLIAVFILLQNGLNVVALKKQ